MSPRDRTPAPSAALAERYGTRPSRRRTVLVAVLSLVVGLSLSWLAWVMLVHGRPLAQSTLVSFDATGPNTVQARFTVVRRDADVQASCLLRAFSADHTIVGELEVPVGPDQPDRVTLTRQVRTEREATSVEMVGCTAEGQTRRR